MSRDTVAPNPSGPLPHTTAAPGHRTAPGHALPQPIGEKVPLRVSVDNNRCRLYGICQQESPEVFDLGADGRLRYTARPAPDQAPAVRQAARCCPMQAITLGQAR